MIIPEIIPQPGRPELPDGALRDGGRSIDRDGGFRDILARQQDEPVRRSDSDRRDLERGRSGDRDHRVTRTGREPRAERRDRADNGDRAGDHVTDRDADDRVNKADGADSRSLRAERIQDGPGQQAGSGRMADGEGETQPETGDASTQNGPSTRQRGDDQSTGPGFGVAMGGAMHRAMQGAVNGAVENVIDGKAKPPNGQSADSGTVGADAQAPGSIGSAGNGVGSGADGGPLQGAINAAALKINEGDGSGTGQPGMASANGAATGTTQTAGAMAGMGASAPLSPSVADGSINALSLNGLSINAASGPADSGRPVGTARAIGDQAAAGTVSANGAAGGPGNGVSANGIGQQMTGQQGGDDGADPALREMTATDGAAPDDAQTADLARLARMARAAGKAQDGDADGARAEAPAATESSDDGGGKGVEKSRFAGAEQSGRFALKGAVEGPPPAPATSAPGANMPPSPMPTPQQAQLAAAQATGQSAGQFAGQAAVQMAAQTDVTEAGNTVEKVDKIEGTALSNEARHTAQIREAHAPQRMSPAARAEAFDQIIDRTLRMVKVGDREVTLQLTPDHLGEMKIRVVVERGLVSADLMAQEQITRELMADQQGRLQQALLDSGADQAQVNVSMGEAGSNPQRDDSPSDQERPDNQPEMADGPGRPVVIPRDGGVSIRA